MHAPSSSPTESRSTWRAIIGWVLFAVVLYGPLIDFRVDQGNVGSDLAAIESLVDRHTFYINDSHFTTIDQFKFGDKFFSQKSPVFHVVAAVPYALMHAAGYSLFENTAACLRAITLLVSVIPMGLLLWMIWDHPWARRRSPRWRVLFALAFALGSLETPFAITINHYVAAAAALMMAARRLTEPGERTPLRLGLSVGFWISASMACDVPPAFLLAAAGSAGWLFVSAREKNWNRLIGMASGAAPLLLLYAALNWTILGSPLPANLHAEEMQYYPGSFWKEVRDKAEQGHPEYYQASYARRLWHSTAGHKGVYWMMPLLALATAGGIALTRRREPGWELALGWAVFPPLTIALAMIWAFDLSGGAYNIRHCLATIPPLYGVLAHPAFWPPRRGIKILAGAAAAWGCLIAAIGLINPWSHNTLSAYPPLENLARLALDHPATLPTHWIGPLIDATSVKPDNGWLDFGLALGGYDSGAAIAALKRSIAIDPKAPLPYYHLSILQARQNRFGEAIPTIRKLLELDPENIGAWNNLGMMALNSSQPELAKEAYAQSEKLAPDNAGALFGRLMALDMQGKGKPDNPDLQKALKLYPEDARFAQIAERWGSAYK